MVEETSDEWEVESEEYDQIDNETHAEIDRLGLQSTEERSSLAASSYSQAAAAIYGKEQTLKQSECGGYATTDNEAQDAGST